MEKQRHTKTMITLLGRGRQKVFEYRGESNLLEAILKEGVYLSASCGGRGTCGKCKIQVLEGNLDITDSDRKKLSEQELALGYRLSCKAYPKDSCTLRLVVGDEADFEVVADHEQSIGGEAVPMEEAYAIAIDMGTTTIALSLIGLDSKRILSTYTSVNKQRAYGADVISRMKASIEGKKVLLQESIRRDLLDGILHVIEEAKVSKKLVQRIAIAGNTTMGHLLMGYSCEGLGAYPFTPVNIDAIEKPFSEILGSNYLDIPVIILPGISTFVGGDIVSGLYACSFDREESICLFIDLGTNGEMAIGNKDRLLVSSTAAGPAFEGGNITYGVGSIAGAICKVAIDKDGLTLETIGNKPALGICGTGVMEMTSELIKEGLVDETGLLCDEYFEDGYKMAKTEDGTTITFTQKDIRELQMAKSAIRAGTEILIKEYGITYDVIDTVYLAGGFGLKMNIDKAIHIGLLPRELSDKINAIGNSSLGGAVKYLTDPEAPKRMEHILQIARELHLSNHKDFNDLYLAHMYFGDNT